MISIRPAWSTGFSAIRYCKLTGTFAAVNKMAMLNPLAAESEQAKSTERSQQCRWLWNLVGDFDQRARDWRRGKKHAVIVAFKIARVRRFAQDDLIESRAAVGNDVDVSIYLVII